MTYNRLEETVKKLYRQIDVLEPHQLNMDTIAPRLGFSVIYISGISKYIDSMQTFFITHHLSLQCQWQDFGHELCHALWHAGSQLNMHIEWRLYQEWQAKSFAYEACIPRFMLEAELRNNPHLHPVDLIAEKFGVTLEFAAERYEIHLKRLSQKDKDLLRPCALY